MRSGQKLLEWYPVADSVSNNAEPLGCPTRMIIMQTAFYEPLFQKQTATLTNSKHSLTYSLIPWSTVLPEKLTVPQLAKKLPTFDGT